MWFTVNLNVDYKFVHMQHFEELIRINSLWLHINFMHLEKNKEQSHISSV